MIVKIHGTSVEHVWIAVDVTHCAEVVIHPVWLLEVVLRRIHSLQHVTEICEIYIMKIKRPLYQKERNEFGAIIVVVYILFEKVTEGIFFFNVDNRGGNNIGCNYFKASEKKYYE